MPSPPRSASTAVPTCVASPPIPTGSTAPARAAGAFFDGTTLSRSARDGAEALAANDSGGFFDALGDSFVTGPTGTNVNDLRIILIAP